MTSYLNRARVLVSTVGTGSPLTLGAAFSVSSLTMSEAGAIDGATYSYVITDGNDFEVQEDQVYSASGGTITRGTPKVSKIGGTAGTTKLTLSGNAVMVVDITGGNLMRLLDKNNNLSDVASARAAIDNLSVHGADIASASTINLETATGNFVHVTGTTGITAITLSDGHQRTVVFTGALTITASGSLTLPNGNTSLTVAAGDAAVFVADGSVIRMTDYMPATNLGAATSNASISYSVAQALSDAQKAQARANIGVEKKNYILNGAMMVSQENGTTALTGGGYPADQFYSVFSNAGTCTTAQIASVTPAGSPNRIRYTVTSADASVGASDYAAFFTKLEGLRVGDLKFGSASAKTVTIQFGVKAPAGTYSVMIVNSAANRSYSADYVISGGEANTDVVKSVTIAGDQSGTWLKDNGIGMYVGWSLMCGSTFATTPGSWVGSNSIGSTNQFNFMGTNGNVFELFDVGLYEGSAAPAFIVPDFANTLRECMRYWEKSYDYGLAPGSISTNGMLGSVFFMTSATFTGGGINPLFKVIKRTAATVTIYSPDTGASGKMRDRSNGVDVTPFATDLIGDYGFRSFVQSLTANATLAIYIHFTANARL